MAFGAVLGQFHIQPLRGLEEEFQEICAYEHHIQIDYGYLIPWSHILQERSIE